MFKIKIMVIDAGTVYYMYPMKRKMSFSYIAEKHVEMLRERFNVEAIHLTAASIVNYRRFRGYIHPYFYPLTTNGEIKNTVLKRRSDMIDVLIGVDVADSNHMSNGPWMWLTMPRHSS